MPDRKKLAELWHMRSGLTRPAIFASEDVKLRPVSTQSQADVAVPGMVGKAYKAGGLVIVSVNPAGGKDDFYPTPGDAALYEAAKAMRYSADVERFEKMNDAYQAGMPSWGAQWQHISKILRASNRSLLQLAYPYLVPFRSRDDKGSELSRNIVERGYSLGLVDIIQELKPALVVPVDRHSEAAVERLKIETGMSFDIIYYTRQRNAHAAREIALASIAQHPSASV